MTKNNINKTLEEETSSPVHIINKPLKLETVNEGSNEDDVLVRGNDNTVKYVPQSELRGKPQGLEQVLEQDSNAIDKDIQIKTNFDSQIYSYLNAYGLGNYFNGVGGIGMSQAGITFLTPLEDSGSWHSNSRLHATSTYIDGGNTFLLPVKAGGGAEYTLATLDDIITNSPVSGTTTGIVDNTPLQELGGVDKTINGIRIGKGNGTTTENILLGSANTFGLNTTGDFNTAVGYDSMIANTTGENNSAFGEWALRSNTTGSSNTAIGVNALNANTIGTWNVSIGVNSMNSSVNGYSNVAVGGEALKKNVGGTSNVAVGISSLRDNIGIAASNTNGCHNTALGNSTLIYNVSGAANTAIGSAALARVMTGEHNIGIGYQGGSGITGSRNVVIATSGWVVGGGGITTGNNNMVLAPNNGDNTGITTGSGNIVLGKVTGLSAAASNTITISDGVGNIAITKSTTGELKAPNLTQTLIVSGGATSLVTKGYVDNSGAVDNATTTSLSSASLATTYPNALAGFRVRCLNIASGALTYEKTVAGWIQHPITVVP